METEFNITVASAEHLAQVESICSTIAESARSRGTGIAGHSPAYLRQKMLEGKAVIATQANGKWVGFAYLDVWQQGEFVSHSGLIVEPHFRDRGVAKRIKQALIKMGRQLFPLAKLFSITTSQAVMKLNSEAVMKLNSEAGFQPVAFSQLPQEDRFWNQCATCQNCDILARTGRKYCLCTALLHDPTQSAKN